MILSFTVALGCFHQWMDSRVKSTYLLQNPLFLMGENFQSQLLAWSELYIPSFEVVLLTKTTFPKDRHLEKFSYLQSNFPPKSHDCWDSKTSSIMDMHHWPLMKFFSTINKFLIFSLKILVSNNWLSITVFTRHF